MPRLQPTAASTKRAKSASATAKRGAAARKNKNTGTMAAAASVSPDKPLTEQQKQFVRAWAQGDSIPNALARAGYSVKDNSLGYRMAKMPNVLAYYNKEKAAYEEAAQMTRKKVMDMLLESYDMAKLSAEPATMVSAAREIGKMCGYYEPKKVDINVTVQGAVAMGRMNALSDADLLRIIEEGAAPTLLEGPKTAPQDDFLVPEGQDTSDG